MRSSVKSIFNRNWSTLIGLFVVLYIWASMASSAVTSIPIVTAPGVYGYFGVLVGMIVAAVMFIVLLTSNRQAVLLKCELLVPPLCSTLLIVSRFFFDWGDNWSSFWANSILGFSTFAIVVFACRGIRGEIATKRERYLIPLSILGIYLVYFALVFFIWPIIGDSLSEKISSTMLVVFSFSVVVNMSSRMQKFDMAEAQQEPQLDEARKNRSAIDEIAASREFSPREKEVFALLARGYSTPHIADKLYVSNSTIKTHIARIYRKLGVSKRDELMELIEGYRG